MIMRYLSLRLRGQCILELWEGWFWGCQVGPGPPQKTKYPNQFERSEKYVSIMK